LAVLAEGIWGIIWSTVIMNLRPEKAFALYFDVTSLNKQSNANRGSYVVGLGVAPSMNGWLPLAATTCIYYYYVYHLPIRETEIP
jgi:hypothetical protein